MFAKPTNTGSGGGGHLSKALLRNRIQRQDRSLLTGPLIYGEEALRQLHQSHQNSKQTFRQNRDGQPKAYIPLGKPTVKNLEFESRNETYPRPPPPTPPPTNINLPLDPMIPSKKRLNPKRVPSETFEEFARRVNTLTANNLGLDPHLHDSFVELSLGKSPRKSAFNFGPDHPLPPSITEKQISEQVAKDYEIHLAHFKGVNKPFETTFAHREQRSSGEDSDSFKPADRYWQRNLMKRRNQRNKKEDSTTKNAILPKSAFQNPQSGTVTQKVSKDKVPPKTFRSNIVAQGEGALKRATKLMQESTKLKEKAADTEGVESPRRKELAYVPLKLRGLKRNPKMTFHHRIEQRRENIKSHGFSIELNDEIRKEWNDADDPQLENNLGKEQSVRFSSNNNTTRNDEYRTPRHKNISKETNFLNEPIFNQQSILKLSKGKGRTSLVPSPTEGLSPRISTLSNSKITKYLEDLRLSGYPYSSSKAKVQKQRLETYKFIQDRKNFEVDESTLDDFGMSSTKKEEFFQTMNSKRLQKIRMKAVISSRNSSEFLGGRPGRDSKLMFPTSNRN